jgi:REP element-mobilizing transposase RayT
MISQMELDLEERTWGGFRVGAGRKKSKDRRDPEHRSRPQHLARNPVHVTMRTLKSVGRLRRGKVYRAAWRALRKIAALVDFRVVHISIQHNHIHLLAEAGSNEALESGMRRLSISLARQINKSLSRRGKVFEFRYHSEEITSPTQTRNALAYVLNNWRRHREDEGFDVSARTAKLDKFSSAILFTGWADFRLTVWPENYDPLPVSPPQTWLLKVGWQLARRPIKPSDTPGPL